jgi:hypothetical protein
MLYPSTRGPFFLGLDLWPFNKITYHFFIPIKDTSSETLDRVLFILYYIRYTEQITAIYLGIYINKILNTEQVNQFNELTDFEIKKYIQEYITNLQQRSGFSINIVEDPNDSNK